MKKALITGIFGQDGTLLSEYLINIGYEVYGVARTVNDKRVSKAKVLTANINNLEDCRSLFNDHKFDECYHLAAYHHSSHFQDESSLEKDRMMIETNFKSTENIVSAIIEKSPITKLFYAGSSQMFSPTKFGDLITEETIFNPSTFYGHTKVFSCQLIDYYKKNHNLFGVTGFLFNHESHLRSTDFISRLITKRSVEISQNKTLKLEVRNPFGVTDWSAAKDFVKGFHLALQTTFPQNLIFSSGKQYEVMDIIKLSFKKLNLNIEDHLIYPNDAKKPAMSLVGDNSLLKSSTGWKPEYNLEELIDEMINHDLKQL